MLAQTFSHHHDLNPSRMTTSLVVTPPLRTQSTGPLSTSRPSRPKLSLNTTQATRTLGKGSSLRLETLSAVSPTVINTFANGYEPERSQPATTGRPVRPKLCIDSSTQSVSDHVNEGDNQDSRTPSSSSVGSNSTCSSAASATIPYSISQVLNSVLANSPLPKANIRRMSIRPRFPAEKKVSFRTPLVEEIVNVKYTLAHSDISLSDASDEAGSSISLTSEEEEEDEEEEQSSSSSTTTYASTSTESTLSLEQPMDSSRSLSGTTSPRSPLRRRRLPHRSKPKNRSPQAGDKRDSSSEDSDSDACPETPVAGRRKRRREWVWTLGTLPGQDNLSTSTQKTSITSISTTFSSTSASASDLSS